MKEKFLKKCTKKRLLSFAVALVVLTLMPVNSISVAAQDVPPPKKCDYAQNVETETPCDQFKMEKILDEWCRWECGVHGPGPGSLMMFYHEGNPNCGYCGYGKKDGAPTENCNNYANDPDSPCVLKLKLSSEHSCWWVCETHEDGHTSPVHAGGIETCPYCGYGKIFSMSSPDPDESPNPSKDTNDTTSNQASAPVVSPKTGENGNLFAWMLIMISSLGVFMSIGKRRDA